MAGKNQKSRRKDMPSRASIAAYWNSRWEIGDNGLHQHPFGYTRIGADLLPDDECWACGYHHGIERCHIHSLADGGSNEPDNLVLLCEKCHRTSEILSPAILPIWLRWQRANAWKSYAEHMTELLVACGFGPAWIEDQVRSGITSEEAVAVMKKQMFAYGDQ